MTQQEFNTKHHKTIWHIRQTVWRWKKKDGGFDHRPHWVPYFCKMMVILGVIPKMEVKQVCEALKDAIESNLMENPGLTWDGAVMQCHDINVPFEVFCERRFGEDQPEEEQQQERAPEIEVMDALISLSRQVEDVKRKVRKLIDEHQDLHTRLYYQDTPEAQSHDIPESLMDSLGL